MPFPPRQKPKRTLSISELATRPEGSADRTRCECWPGRRAEDRMDNFKSMMAEALQG